MQFLAELWKKLMRADKGAAENMRDYVADATEAITARKKEIANFRVKVAEVNQVKRGLDRQYQESLAEVNKWSAVLDRIKGSDREVEEKKAKALPVLTARNNAQARVEDLNRSIAMQDDALAKLRQQLMDAQSDLAEKERSLATLAAREQAVKIRTGLSEAAAAFDKSRNTLGAIDELEQKVRTEEDRIEALEEEYSLTKPGSAAEAVAAEFDPKRLLVQAELDEMFGPPALEAGKDRPALESGRERAQLEAPKERTTN